MAILRNKQAGKFTQVPNKLILDSEDMNDKVFRIIIYLMSRPDNWKVNNSDIMRRHKIKTRGTMGKYWKEMIVTGWVSRTQAPKRAGTFTGYDYEVHYSPRTISPCTDQTDTEPNHVRSDDTHSNTDSLNNTDINNNTDFIKPTLLICIKYLRENKNMKLEEAKAMATKFESFYDNCNWMVGKGSDRARMQNWKLALAGWYNRTVKKKPFKATKKSTPRFEDSGVDL